MSAQLICKTEENWDDAVVSDKKSFKLAVE